MLHAPQGAAVAVLGPQAGLLLPEVLRWQDVRTVWTDSVHPDRRIHVGAPPPHSCDVVLLSQDTNPAPFFSVLRMGGVISASTKNIDLWGGLCRRLRTDLGLATPWRAPLAEPIYGCLASLRTKNGAKLTRTREVPHSAEHLSTQYIPCLFTFSADEMTSLRQGKA
jgi:hypothetical protein